MIVSMDFEDEVFYIIPPGPESGNFKILKEHEDSPITVPHIKNSTYHSREQVELNLYRCEMEAATNSTEKKYWKEKYKKLAEIFPEYVL